MAEVAARILTEETRAALAAMEARVAEATLLAAREAGALVVSRARAQAPVYRGDRGDIVPGLLRNSIRERIARDALGVRARISPGGDRVHLYEAKIEAAQPYMRTAYEQAVGAVEEIFVRAWRGATG